MKNEEAFNQAIEFVKGLTISDGVTVEVAHALYGVQVRFHRPDTDLASALVDGIGTDTLESNWKGLGHGGFRFLSWKPSGMVLFTLSVYLPLPVEADLIRAGLLEEVAADE